ncbi:hypothetical protein HYT57_02635 [Candidatus Woesearchaeota archaeon]|nr:hypothetical protein [Candidatus Woesearchaeota archaeon]
MVNVAIGHYDDVDGVLSHALLERASIANGQNTVHLDIDYKDMVAPLKLVDLEQAKVARIFDLGHNKSWESQEFVGELRRITQATSLEIYDHHRWPDSSQVYEVGARRIVVPRGTDNLERRCTSEIINFFFTPNDPTALLLSQIASNSDFMPNLQYQGLDAYTRRLEWVVAAADKRITELRSIELVQYFATLPKDHPKNASLLDSKYFWPDHFQVALEEYGSAVESAKQSLEKTIRIEKVQTPSRDYEVVIGFAPQILHMKEGVRHLQGKHPGLPIYACAYEDNSIIFSRDTEEVNLLLLGRAFNGGGRESGAGGFLPGGFTAELGEITVYHVLEIIKEALSNIP